MSERIIREFVKQQLLIESLSYLPTARIIASRLNAEVGRGDLFKPVSATGHVRIGPQTREASEVIKNMNQDQLSGILQQAGLEVVAIYGPRDSKNKHSSTFDAYMVRPKPEDLSVEDSLEQVPDADEDLTTVVFSYRGATPKSALNESMFVNTIKEYASDTQPITVRVGKWSAPNIVDAVETGATRVAVTRTTDSLENGQSTVVTKEASKADVILFDTRGQKYKISLKLPSAQYWLSGDTVLKDLAKAEIEKNENTPSGVRFIEKDGNYEMYKNGVPISGYAFELNEETKQKAVFGTGDNAVDVVLKGDFIKEPPPPIRGVLEFPGIAYETLKELENTKDEPVGLLRKGEQSKTTGRRRGIKDYPGIRVAIVTKSRVLSLI